MTWRKILILSWLVLLLAACQQTSSHQVIMNWNQDLPLQLVNPALKSQRIYKTLEFNPQGTLSLVPQGDLMKALFRLNLPQPDGFKTQTLPLSSINYVKIEVTGVGIGTPLWADGADGSGLVVNAGGNIALTVSNIPYGNVRVATLTAYDASQIAIPGAVIKTGFNVSAPVHNVEISYRTTVNGEVLQDMLSPQSTANDHLSSLVNLANLTTFVDSLTGKAGTYPNYTFTTHPTLINTAAIASDLLGNGGDPTLLNPANPAYLIAPGTITGTVTGLVSSDTAQLQISDPASAILANQGNGGLNISSVTPGSWSVLRTLTPGAGTTYTVSGSNSTTVGTGGTDNLGTITFTPATPNITSLSANSAKIGTTLSIHGSNFHSNANGNVVKFDTVTILTANITVISQNQLNVVVPAGILGTLNITVSVGTETSNNQSFTVLPNITGVTPNTGFNDDLTEITITGTGFQTTPTIQIGATSATNILYDSATQVRATVPAALSAATYTTTLTNPDTNSDAEINSFTVQVRSENWNTANSGIGGLSGNIQALMINPTTPSTLYSGSSLGGAFKTTDEGSNWSTVNVGLLALTVQALAINPASPNTIYAATNLGINKSTDGGSNWSTVNTGLPALGKNTVALAVNPTTATILYAGLTGALGNGVYKSTDSAGNWSATALTGNIQALAVDPSAPSTLYAGKSSGLSRSTDSGASWTAINTGLTNTDVQTIVVHPTNSNVLYVGTAGGVFVSTNQGANWSAINTGLSNTNVRALAIHPRATSTLYAGTANGLFKSINNGTSWTDISGSIGNSNIYSLAIEPNPATNVTPALYVGTASAGVYKTQ